MRLRAKTSSREQGPDFDLVWTCEWLSYMRASGSQAYDMLVRFFSCRMCISIRVTATLSVMSGSLSLHSSHSMLVYYFGFKDLDLDMHYDYCIYLPLTLTWVNVCLFMHVLVCRYKHSN
jgi:hypothetical protein